MKLTVEEMRELVWELDQKINHYVDRFDLFSGGCCFSAYALAKNLKKLGVKYNVVLYQYDEILNEKKFNKAINGEGVAHVAIEVDLGGLKWIIGNCAGIYIYFHRFGYEYNIRSYKRINPMELLQAYRHNDWNPYYNRECNGPLMRDINAIVEKYLDKRIGK